VLLHEWMLVGAIVIGVIVLKASIIYALAKAFGIGSSDRWLATLGLAQAGEFGFVLLAFSQQNSVLPAHIAEILALVVAISMFLTPALFIFFDKVLVPRFETNQTSRPHDVIDTRGRVLIAGIGRFGQIINRLLVANGIETVVLDHDAKQVDNLRELNIRSYFGDATHPMLLETAGIDEIDLFVIAIDDRERAVELTAYLKESYPHLSVLTRAFDQVHYYQLKRAGADVIIKETYHSALNLGYEALTRLGQHPFLAEQLKNAFIETEEETAEALYQNWLSSDKSGIRQGFRELFMQQEVALREAMEEHSENQDLDKVDAEPAAKN
jgi:voltage-gated potassium channel Kch